MAAALPVPALGAFWPKTTALPKAEEHNTDAWWALSDLTVHGHGKFELWCENRKLRDVVSHDTVRCCWPPDLDILFPAEAKLEWKPPGPKYWCAIIRAPHQKWFISSDNTLGRYIPLDDPDRHLRQEEVWREEE